MANTESLVPEHHTPEELVEKNIHEEVPAKQGEIPPSKEYEENDEKTDKVECSEIPVTKLEETQVDKQIEPTVTGAGKFIQTPALDEAVSQPEERCATDVVEKLPEEKPVKNDVHEETKIVEHELQEKPAVEEISTITPEEKPTLEVVEKEKPVTEVVEMEKPAVVETSTITPEEKPAVEVVEKDKAVTEAEEKLETEAEKTPAIEVIENESKEKPVIVVVESVAEENPVIKAVESEPENKPVTKEVENEPEEKPSIENIPEEKPAVIVEETPEGKPEIYEEKPAIEIVEKEPEEKVADEATESAQKDQVLSEPVEVKAEESEVRTVAPNSTVEEIPLPVNHVEVTPLKDSEPELLEHREVSEADFNTVEKRESVDEVEVVPPVQSHIVEEVSVKTEDKPVVNVGAVVLKDEVPVENPHFVEEVTAKIENVISSDISEFAGKSIGVEQVKENAEVVIPAASVESDKEKDLEGKDNGTNENPSTDEQTGEPKDSQLDVKVEKTVEAVADELETTKEVVDAIKSDAPNAEAPKDSDDTKTARDLPIPEVPVKSSQKQSGSIISKVKHSLVKVKKAIIGKSPSSKTLSPEVKVEENAK